MSSPERRSRRRLVWSGTVAAAVVASALSIPTSGAGSGTASLAEANEARKASLGIPHQDPPGTPPHTHNDPATKNLISRAGEVGRNAQDPTTAAERTAAAAYVASERRLPDPQLRKAPLPSRAKVPSTRYALANGCYSLAGQPIFFKPTTLGVYLLYDKQRRIVVAGGGRAAEPGPTTEWTARKVGDRFAFTNAGKRLRIKGTDRFALRVAKGCTRYPEADINIHGAPFAGVTPYQEVRGYVDGHTHGMAFEFLGGRVHCGRPWHEYGAPYALKDCPDHSLTQGYGAILETFFSGQASHDPVGWPTFKDWPAPNSLTHEGTYYRWLERAWRGGQRLFVNLLVENNKLCQVYPLKRNSCDDMDSIRLQAKDMYRIQDYIDAQAGGPGKGFYRIVTDPFEARRVINAGKMAVVMGIETSVPFGCTIKLDRPACNANEIDRQLTEVHRLGVRQMELVNKFDNALSGVAGDQGEVGVVVNGANFLETGSFWDMRHCEPADGESHDNNQVALPDIGAEQQDALFGAIGQLFGALGSAVLPLYPPPDHCNSAGPDHARRVHDQGPGEAQDDLRPRPHEREGPPGRDEPDRADGLPRRHLLALLGHARRLPPGLQGRRLHHAVRRRLDRLRRQVASPRRLGRPSLLLGHRLRRRHQRARRAGRPARRRRPQQGDLPVPRAGRGADRQAALRQAGLRHQRRRRRAVRPLPRLDPGPEQGRGQGRRRRSPTTCPAAPRPTCRCGSARSASRPTRAATRACASRWPPSSDWCVPA